jgi:hypothetical protein
MQMGPCLPTLTRSPPRPPGTLDAQLSQHHSSPRCLVGHGHVGGRPELYSFWGRDWIAIRPCALYYARI